VLQRADLRGIGRSVHLLAELGQFGAAVVGFRLLPATQLFLIEQSFSDSRQRAVGFAAIGFGTGHARRTGSEG
jgi:hypothetical protein